MKSVEAFNKYADACGVKDFKADGLTMILGEKNQLLKDLDAGEEKKGFIDYYINFDYPFPVKKADKICCDRWTIINGEHNFFICNDVGIILMYAGIYEVHACRRHGHLLAITGHEQSAVISLDHLEDSFVYYTR